MDELQTVWGTLPALYLFLAGAAAGTFFVSAVLQVANSRRYGRVACVGFVLALALLAAGLLCLVAETEKPWRAILLPLSFTNASSWMTIGAWLLLAAFAVYAAAGALSAARVRVLAAARGDAVLRVLSIAGAALSVGVAAYSAMLLMAAPAVPLWSNPILVAVFLASAASMGVAVVSLIVRWEAARDGWKATHADQALEGEAAESAEGGSASAGRVCEPVALRVALVAAPVIELCAVAAFLYATGCGSSTQQRSFELIASGPLAVRFWLGAIAIGMAVPGIIAFAEAVLGRVREKNSAAHWCPAALCAGALSCVCSLAGAFCLRSVIVAAGVHASLVFPVATAAAAGLTL